MPVEVGIQRGLIFLGSRMRGNDDRVVIQSFPRVRHSFFGAFKYNYKHYNYKH